MPVHDHDVKISFRNAVGGPVSDTDEIAIYNPPASANSAPSIYVGSNAILSVAHYVPVAAARDGSNTYIHNYGELLQLRSSKGYDSSYVQVKPNLVTASASGLAEYSTLMVSYGTIDLTSNYTISSVRTKEWRVAVSGQGGVSVHKTVQSSEALGADTSGCAFRAVSDFDLPARTMVAGHRVYLGAWRETEEFGYAQAGQSELTPTQSIKLESASGESNGVYVISQSPDSLSQQNIMYGSWCVLDAVYSPSSKIFGFNVGKITDRDTSSFESMLQVGYEYNGDYNMIRLTADTIRIGHPTFWPSPFANETYIYGVVTPTADDMAVNKQYVDNQVAKRATVLKGTLVIPPNAWTTSNTSAPYAARTAAISVPNSGIQAGDDVFIAPNLQFTDGEWWVYDYAKIAGVAAAENALSFVAYEQPQDPIKIKWMIIR